MRGANTTKVHNTATDFSVSIIRGNRTQTNVCDRAFSAAWPQVWNYLPMDLRQPD